MPSGDPRIDRIAHNEARFREVNEGIEARIGQDVPDRRTAFVCECGKTECRRMVELTAAEYEHVRSHPLHFFVVNGHEIPDAERVVERNEHFSVVEKLPAAADIAIDADRRHHGTGGSEPS